MLLYGISFQYCNFYVCISTNMWNHTHQRGDMDVSGMRGDEERGHVGGKLLTLVMSMPGMTSAMTPTNSPSFPTALFATPFCLSLTTLLPPSLSPSPPIRYHAQPSAHREIMGCRQSGREDEEEENGGKRKRVHTETRKWDRRWLKEEAIRLQRP